MRREQRFEGVMERVAGDFDVHVTLPAGQGH
jgi:hypothetical protein